MGIINLTPHPITVYGRDEKVVTIEPSGVVAKILSRQESIGWIDVHFGHRVPLVVNRREDVDGLPDPQSDTMFIVSSLVLAAVRDKRDDVVAPDTEEASAVRDGKGNIIGIRRFTR